MKSVIVGTAGHIDHGKTALVKALTDIDADRLEEEKRRGITIDIGFAHLEIPSENGETLRVGFVDVPGHERFVRNMLAGIGGIDLVLLVIAADESIKPQTREHFDICRLLSVSRGITVITKSDSVDKETLDVARLEIEDFVRGSFLDSSQSPIVSVSSITGAGLDELKRQLTEMASHILPRNSKSLARLPVDRVFTMKGFGTVATGTLISGMIRVEDELEIFPTRKRVRVRGIQVHGQPANETIAGQRTALNLAGVSTEELERGVTLASPSVFQPGLRFDVSLSLLASATPLKQHTKVHFHSYTMESVAGVRFYDGKALTPGHDAFAQLKLKAPALLLPGDRFIIRQFSPVVTIGGGIVLDNSPENKIRTRRTGYLELLKEGSQSSTIRARIMASGTRGISIPEAVAQTGWRPQEILSVVSEIPDIRQMGESLIGAPALDVLLTAAVSVLDAFHKQNPLVGGMSKKELGERLPAHAPQVFDILIEEASREKKLEITAEFVRLPGRGVVLKDEEAESKKIIEDAFKVAGLRVPALKDVLSGLKVDKTRAQKITTLLLREKVLVKVSDDLVFHSKALADLRKCLATEKLKSPHIDVARFKDLTGVSRKYAIPLLEYLDREHVTRRVGDQRVFL